MGCLRGGGLAIIHWPPGWRQAEAGWLSLNPAQSCPVLGLSQEPMASSSSRESVRETSECVRVETLTRDGREGRGSTSYSKWEPQTSSGGLTQGHVRMQTLRPHPELLNQSLHLTDPKVSVCTLLIEKHSCSSTHICPYPPRPLSILYSPWLLEGLHPRATSVAAGGLPSDCLRSLCLWR